MTAAALGRSSTPYAFATPDYALAAVAGVLAAAISLYASTLFDARLYTVTDVYFQSDSARVLGSMAHRLDAGHGRTSVHPLFSIFFNPPVQLALAFGAQPIDAARALMAACGAATAALLFLALRGLALPRAAAALFTAVYLASATHLHWSSVVETYGPAALSVTIALFLLVSPRGASSRAWTAASVATLAITVTNWTAALAATLVRLGMRRALRVGVAALAIAAGLALVQKAIYPTSALFFNPLSLGKEVKYTQVYSEATGTGSWSPLANVRSFLLTSAVAPAPAVVEVSDPVPLLAAAEPSKRRRIVSNQGAPLSAYDAAGLAAVVAWLVALALGALGAWRSRDHRAAALGVGLFLLGQLCLHLVYGEIIFLYAAHFFPALIVLAAFGWHTRLRGVAVAAGTVVLLAGGAANWNAFQAAVQLTNSLLSAS